MASVAGSSTPESRLLGGSETFSSASLLSGSSTPESRLMGGSETFYSASLLWVACNLSCSVYIRERDDPFYVRTDIGNTVVFAFRGSLDSQVVTSATTKYGECQIHDIGCLEWMKDGNNQPASVHKGALSQFLDIWNDSPLQEKEMKLEFDENGTYLFTYIVSYY